MRLKGKTYGLAIVSLLVITTSCHFLNKKDDDEKGKVIARVYDKYLYEEDLNNIVDANSNLSSRDSSVIVQNYINIWAKDQLMLYKAEYNLNEDQKNFEEQINKYQNDLLKFAYQEEYLQQNLDTNISDAEILEYYNESKDNFLLKENILRANYLIINPNAPKIREAKKWFRSKDEKDRSELTEYAIKYASEFYLEDSIWMSFDRIASKIPFEKEMDQSEFLAKNNFVEISDTNKIYLLEVVEYKGKNDHAPLSYLGNVIRNILINKKKLQLLTDLEKNLLEDALKKKEFETY